MLDGIKFKWETKAINQVAMVYIQCGEFLMGSDQFYPEEDPIQNVMVDGFYMDHNFN